MAAKQRPRKGWVYWVDPHKSVVSCKMGHKYLYDLTIDYIECKHPSCALQINPSRVLRQTHPYVVWSRDEFHDTYNRVDVFTALPLTSSQKDKGLPTIYPIEPTSKNGLRKDGYVLVHQIVTIDANCFKDTDGRWKERIGQLNKKDKQEIERRLKYYLDISEEPNGDWFVRNASIELLKKVYESLPNEEKEKALEELVDLEIE